MRMKVYNSSWYTITECNDGCEVEKYNCSERHETFYMKNLDDGGYWLMLHPYYVLDEMAHYVLEAHCESDEDWEDIRALIRGGDGNKVNENNAVSQHLAFSALLTTVSILI